PERRRAVEVLREIEAQRIADLLAADAEIVEERDSPDVLGAPTRRNVARRGPEHDRDLALVVERLGALRIGDVVVGTGREREVLPESAQPRALARPRGDLPRIELLSRRDDALERGRRPEPFAPRGSECVLGVVARRASDPRTMNAGCVQPGAVARHHRVVLPRTERLLDRGARGFDPGGAARDELGKTRRQPRIRAIEIDDPIPFPDPDPPLRAKDDDTHGIAASTAAAGRSGAGHRAARPCAAGTS